MIGFTDLTTCPPSPLYNGRYTQLTCIALRGKHVNHQNMVVNFLFIICKQLISSIFKTPVSLLSKKNLSNENLNIKDITYQQQVFP